MVEVVQNSGGRCEMALGLLWPDFVYKREKGEDPHDVAYRSKPSSLIKDKIASLRRLTIRLRNRTRNTHTHKQQGADPMTLFKHMFKGREYMVIKLPDDGKPMPEGVMRAFDFDEVTYQNRGEVSPSSEIDRAT